MDKLLEKYNDYMRIIDCKAEYELDNGKKIDFKYILFEEKSGEYNHMGIAQDERSGNRYVESFFHEVSNKYIRGQIIMKIKKFTLYDSNNAIIVSDSFAC